MGSNPFLPIGSLLIIQDGARVLLMCISAHGIIAWSFAQPFQVTHCKSVIVSPNSKGRLMSSLAARMKWTSTTYWLALCGFNIALVFLLIFLLPFQLVKHFAAVLPSFFDFPNASPALVLVGWIILFQFYYIAYRLCPVRPSKAVMTLIVAFPLFFSLILFLMYPWGANDIFDQIFRAHIFVDVGASPLAVRPLEFPKDPLLPYVWWRFAPSSYGPVWELISAVPVKLIGHDLLGLLFGDKLLAIAHFWGSMALVYRTLRIFKPEFAVRGFLLFAWNPFLQFEFVGNGHNDAVLVFWLLAAVYLQVRGRHLLSLLALTTAVLVKFLPIFLIPLFLAALWHTHSKESLLQRSKHLMIAIGAMALLAFLAFLPFGGPIPTIQFIGETSQTYWHSSIPWLVWHTFQTQGIGGDKPANAVRVILLVVMATVVLWHSIRLLRGSSEPRAVKERVIQSSFEIMFAWLMFASQYLNPWYTTWLFAFIPFLPRFGYAERGLLFNITALSAYFIWFWRWPIGSPTGDVAEVMLFWAIFPLPFLFSIGTWIYRQRGRWPPRQFSRASSVDDLVGQQV